jgi:hypothetical protein
MVSNPFGLFPNSCTSCRLFRAVSDYMNRKSAQNLRVS